MAPPQPNLTSRRPSFPCILLHPLTLFSLSSFLPLPYSDINTHTFIQSFIHSFIHSRNHIHSNCSKLNTSHHILLENNSVNITLLSRARAIIRQDIHFTETIRVINPLTESSVRSAAALLLSLGFFCLGNTEDTALHQLTATQSSENTC